ncbi:MAG TPA: glycosyltransferase family 39 protein, partial [Pyrinomonadaceae bacterium]|nr:glycosyltransferase family 39 protein [Pyrinomonadaceae bacterium]
MSTRTKIGIAATVLIVCIAVFSRFWGLDRSCLWFDEIFSVHAAEHGWQTILSFVALDLIHPPLFYVLLKLWISVGGESLVWLRILPVTLSCICIFPFLMIAKELRLSFWQRTVGLLIFAVNGSLVKYAQEVRMYSLLQLLSLISIWLFIRYFIRGKSLSALIVVNLILVYSHYFGWFVITGGVLAIVIFQRIKIRAVLLMFAGVFVGFLPWVI